MPIVMTPPIISFVTFVLPCLGTLEQLRVKSKCRQIILYRSPQWRYRVHMPQVVCF